MPAIFLPITIKNSLLWAGLKIIILQPMELQEAKLATKKTAIIFPICITLFLLNPIGRQAWMYSLIWLIPFVATFFKKKLILNSLGATFTAHAIGSVIFLYTFGLTPAIWIGLIPVVFIERGVFTLGIWTSCLVLNTVLDKLTNFKMVSFLKPLVNQNYLISQ